MSFIRIRCFEDADPERNIIKLRTNPPTFIELKPGENILDIEDYPDLKSEIFYISLQSERISGQQMSSFAF